MSVVGNLFNAIAVLVLTIAAVEMIGIGAKQVSMFCNRHRRRSTTDGFDMIAATMWICGGIICAWAVIMTLKELLQ